MMDRKEFEVKLRKADQKHPSNIRNSWGVYDCYKHIRKNGWYDIGRPLKEKEFYSIVRNVNKLLAKEAADGHTVTFPSRMGCLELHKIPVGVSIVKGTLKNTYSINWKETMKLWFEDEEARQNKTLIRSEYDYNYYIKYAKHTANYENKYFYQFAVNRFMKLAMLDNVNKGKIDALW